MTSTVIYEGELRTVALHIASGTTIETDAPVDNQGKGERFSPSDLVATALGSCMMTIMGQKARDHKIDLKGTRIEIQKMMKAEPRKMSGVSLTFHMPDNLHVSEKQIIILQRAAETCPVMLSIHPEIKVELNFNWPTAAEKFSSY
ncbi:MAG TPA: OsmC family protein [Puia sp.]